MGLNSISSKTQGERVYHASTIVMRQGSWGFVVEGSQVAILIWVEQAPTKFLLLSSGWAFCVLFIDNDS